MSANDRKSGSVKFFDQNKGWGFVTVDGGDFQEVFFRLEDYRAPNNSDKPTDRIPCKGDQIVFKLVSSGKGDKASPWAFEVEFPVALQGKGQSQRIISSRIREINRADLRDDDLYTCESEYWGSNPIVWFAIIYRPTTKEIFKIRCWDGERGGYQPDIPCGQLPDGVTVEWEI